MRLMLAINFAISNIRLSADRYSDGILMTKRRKTCSEIARSANVSHDVILRDLEKMSKNLAEIRAMLFGQVLEKSKHILGGGALIVDSTVAIKEYAQKIEGVSRQYSGSEKSKIKKPGISFTVAGWTDLKDDFMALDVFAWKKGDQSKVKTAAALSITLAQRLGVRLILQDGAFVSIRSMIQYNEADLYTVMRMHNNRVVAVDGYEGTAQIKKHKAFIFSRNQRCMVRSITWHGLKLCVIAIKRYHKKRGWQTLFLITNAPLNLALEYAQFYKHRWKIESFFRTSKQDLGLGQSQVRSLKKQEAHALGVLIAYNRASRKKAIPIAKNNPRMAMRPMKRKIFSMAKTTSSQPS